VLLEAAVEGLAVRAGGTYVDATFGAGGHARAIAALVGWGRLVALDVDPSAGRYAADVPGAEFVHADFGELAAVLDRLGIDEVDGVLFDLGVSSMQFDQPARGFSLREEGPLDMRMDPARSRSARDLLATAGEEELARLLRAYGEERAARRIARAIVGARNVGRLPQTTTDLARLVSGVLHVRGRRERIHPATRTFQALRIAVNDELGALERGLGAAIARTRPGGRIVAISFHSLEDRIVKQTFRDDARVRAVTRRPIVPTAAEQDANPRSRSARLRVAERLG
jgi:16S rRNA (cytosine1402-N4)-methyltransferase